MKKIFIFLAFIACSTLGVSASELSLDDVDDSEFVVGSDFKTNVNHVFTTTSMEDFTEVSCTGASLTQEIYWKQPSYVFYNTYDLD